MLKAEVQEINITWRMVHSFISYEIINDFIRVTMWPLRKLDIVSLFTSLQNISVTEQCCI